MKMKVMESLATRQTEILQANSRDQKVCGESLEKAGLNCKNKADSVHEFHNDEFTNISTKLVLSMKKLTYFF